ncbi:hypothetical protein JCM10908_006912 [Rhodotorula pacifica]|uniref:Rim9p n=1 Tax=Rhodotorula pacifica TaxID=1495444 RepID=UPI003173379A
MAFGFRPATPGTLVVLAATVLLVLVSVSVPITKSIYFLKANIVASVEGIDITGTVTLGCWGYCIGDNCTASKLGYNLDILKLFGSNGSISGVSNAVLKWITYLLILHPIAAALAGLSTVMGLVAHLRGFGATCFTTCIASLAATVALLAFVFDIVVFLIAKNRIEAAASGESAQLGNAVWMTLAAMILLLTSGFFFGCGACIFRRQRHEKQVSDLYRPQPDTNYGNKMRQDAYASNARPISGESANLPAFAEYDHADPEKGLEQVPLNSQQAQYSPPRQQQQTYPPTNNGYGGYGHGYDDYNQQQPTSPTRANQQLRFAAELQGSGAGYASAAGDMIGAGAGVGSGIGGKGARLAAEARAQRGMATEEDMRFLNGSSSSGGHVEPFAGMYGGGGGADDGYATRQQADDSYAANPYYTQSQAAEPTSPTRLVGPRSPSTAPAPGASLQPPSSSYHQQQQNGEPPVLPYRQGSNDTYGAGGAYTTNQQRQASHDDYGYPTTTSQGQGQSYTPPPPATDDGYYQHQQHQQQASTGTDMYGAPLRY